MSVKLSVDFIETIIRSQNLSSEISHKNASAYRILAYNQPLMPTLFIFTQMAGCANVAILWTCSLIWIYFFYLFTLLGTKHGNFCEFSSGLSDTLVENSNPQFTNNV
jgi:hypothetical protein